MAGRHVIGRCTVLRQAGGPDPAAARAWAQRALARADLDDVVAPAATLVLRSAAVPARGAAPALRARAREAAAHAARPAHAAVGAGADAVLFADDAELLACLARDLLSGALPTAWWWASARGGGDPLAWMARMWVERPLAMPAAVHALTASGHAARFLAALPDEVVAALASEAAAAGVLPAPVAARCLGGRGPADRVDPGPVEEAATVAHGAPAARARAALGPIRDGPAARLGVALLLAHREPAALERLAATLAAAPAAPEWELMPPPAAAPRARPRPAPPGRRHRRDSPAPRPAAHHDRPPQRRSRPGLHAPHPAPEPPADPPRPGDAQPTRTPAHAEPTAPAAAPPGVEDSAPAPAVTRLAGAFLLITVAQDLGLYSDFTRPRARGLDLSPWAWLAHTTAHLAGVRDPADPLWALLAELAGEPELEPGAAPALRITSRRVAHRLDRALGRRRTARHVVVRPGAVHAGPMRIDVVFPLSTLDLAVRVSGLDRDPGWLPAGARDVRLYYR